MMEASEIIKETKGDTLTIKVKGFISETSKLFQEDLNTFSNVVIDFEETSFINSLGIRLWMEWLKSEKVPESTHLTLVNCVPSIVSQFNMIKGFVPGNCVVQSLFVNYYIEDSAVETKVLLQKSVDFEPEIGASEGWVKVKDEIISEKGEELILDTIKEKYFSFLGKVKYIDG